MTNNRQYFVYIMANAKPVLYIGVTNNLVKRVHEHKEELAEGFTKQYNLKKLVYFETFSEIAEAIKREKQLKHWKRTWKLALIQKTNLGFNDLYGTII